MSTKPTIVHLVGAGPGDPGLLTIAAKTLLQEADVVIYDYLASDPVRRFANPDARQIFVGKKGFSEHITQDQINALIVTEAQKAEGLSIVRLKGGDPFVFGRGGEEALALHEAGIAFDVVPGVTSGIAAPAYAGIPVTHRGLASSMAFVTGHETPEKNESAIDWEHLAHGVDTLCFYMGIRNLPLIAGKLMAAGRPADTPVALVRWGTTPNQEVLTATLATVADEAARVNFKAPAIIVVGEVARLRDSIAWFDQRPLFGKTVVVTRSREQASALSERLAAAGANVVEFPTIAIEPRPLSDELQQAVKKLAEGAFAWVVFTSANGVTCFFERLAELGRDSRTFAGAKVCAIGPATAAALASHGITADVLPKRFVAESVLEALFAHGLTAGQAVLIPRAAKARDVLPRTLAERGVDACVLPVYDTVIPSRDDQTANLAELFRTGSIDAITFTSSSTASNFATLMGKELEDGELPGLLQGVTCASIGPVTSGTMVAHGIPVSIQATEYTIPALADAVIGTLQAHPAEEPTTAPSVPCQPTEERNQLA